MQRQNRPSAKELAKKLQAAKEALAEQRLRVVNYEKHVIADLEWLNVTESIYWELIPQLVDEAIRVGANISYAGRHPPVKSYEDAVIKGLDLWAFQVPMPGFAKPIYFKFALKPHPKTNELTYCHVNCHPQREKED